MDVDIEDYNLKLVLLAPNIGLVCIRLCEQRFCENLAAPRIRFLEDLIARKSNRLAILILSRGIVRHECVH